MSVGTFLRVWDNMGVADVVAEDEPRIDAAVQHFLDTGGHADTLLDLTMTSGASYRILASQVRSWMVSTPESRARSMELEKAHADEDREHRIAAGLPWEE